MEGGSSYLWLLTLEPTPGQVLDPPATTPVRTKRCIITPLLENSLLLAAVACYFSNESLCVLCNGIECKFAAVI